jgi:NAD(P)H dehydrogenase (quinone)
MAEVLGRPVQAQAIPRAQWAPTLESFGTPLGAIGPYEEMLDGFNSGWIDFGVPGTERVEGTTTPVQVFQQAWKPEKAKRFSSD